MYLMPVINRNCRKVLPSGNHAVMKLFLSPSFDINVTFENRILQKPRYIYVTNLMY